MTENYQPPKHPWIILGEDYGSGPWIQIHDPDYDGNIHCSPDEAIKLGLALMENGLHLKEKQKKPQTAQGATDATEDHERKPE